LKRDLSGGSGAAASFSGVGGVCIQNSGLHVNNWPADQ
jgi:hypothetical protein